MRASELTGAELLKLCQDEGLLPEIRYEDDVAFPWSAFAIFVAVLTIIVWEMIRYCLKSWNSAYQYYRLNSEISRDISRMEDSHEKQTRNGQTENR